MISPAVSQLVVTASHAQTSSSMLHVDTDPQAEGLYHQYIKSRGQTPPVAHQYSSAQSMEDRFWLTYYVQQSNDCNTNKIDACL